MTLPWQPLRWRKRRREFRRIAAFFKQSFELKIKGDLIPEAAAEEIIGELQTLFARHNAGDALGAKAVFKPTKEFHTARDRINFELGMLNLELQRSPKSPSGFSFQVSRFSFFLRGAGRGEREDEAREVRDGGGVTLVVLCFTALLN
jgi:hypothetical protein